MAINFLFLKQMPLLLKDRVAELEAMVAKLQAELSKTKEESVSTGGTPDGLPPKTVFTRRRVVS